MNLVPPVTRTPPPLQPSLTVQFASQPTMSSMTTTSSSSPTESPASSPDSSIASSIESPSLSPALEQQTLQDSLNNATEETMTGSWKPMKRASTPPPLGCRRASTTTPPPLPPLPPPPPPLELQWSDDAEDKGFDDGSFSRRDISLTNKKGEIRLVLKELVRGNKVDPAKSCATVEFP